MLTLEPALKEYAVSQKTWVTGESLARLLSHQTIKVQGAMYELISLKSSGECLEWCLRVIRAAAEGFEGALGHTVSGGALADFFKRTGSSFTRTAGLLGFRYQLIELEEDSGQLKFVFRITGRSSMIWRSKE